jgi:hypothetical protein
MTNERIRNRLYTTDGKDAGTEEGTGKDGTNVWSQNGLDCLHDGTNVWSQNGLDCVHDGTNVWSQNGLDCVHDGTNMWSQNGLDCVHDDRQRIRITFYGLGKMEHLDYI